MNKKIKNKIYVSISLYVTDEGCLLPKHRDCTTSNDFELYLMCCGVMILLLITYIYIFGASQAYTIYILDKYHSNRCKFVVPAYRFCNTHPTARIVINIFSECDCRLDKCAL